MTQANEHWTILGAGSVGHLIACRFAQLQIPVSLIYRTGQSKNRSLVNYHFNNEVVNCEIQYQTVDEIQSIDYLLLTVKSHQVESAILSIQDKLTPTSQVFLLQNGMGNLEKVSGLLSGIIATSQIYPGTNTHGVYLQKTKGELPEVFHAGMGELVFGANYLHKTNVTKPNCFTTLESLALNSTWSSTIENRLWMKLAINAAINPLTAINFCKNGYLLKSTALKAQVLSLCNETAVLFAVLDIPISEKSIIKEVFRVINCTANNQSSMLQDIKSGKTTEIESITGYLLEKANNNSVSLDVHRQIYDKIKSGNLN